MAKIKIAKQIKDWLRVSFNAGVMASEDIGCPSLADLFDLDKDSDFYYEELEEAIFENWFNNSFKVIDDVSRRRIQNNSRSKKPGKVVRRTSRKKV